LERALRINLGRSAYGTFAEIGAGQEVARWFFRAGGASGTVAKSVSAYDMAISSAIYGASKRFVSRERLQQMLRHELDQLVESLSEKRKSETRLFAFANTVATQSFHPRDECDGWMGLRFQNEIGGPPSEVLVHVRMHDPEAVQQQEALGIIGVNFVDATLNWTGDVRQFLEQLAGQVAGSRIEVDMIQLDGPAFSKVDNRHASLLLVELGLAQSAMFLVDGTIVQASEILYAKRVLVDRGTFRPPTLANEDRLACAKMHFGEETGGDKGDLVVVTEMTLVQIGEPGLVDADDFLARVDLLRSLGHAVLISNVPQYHRLAAFLGRYTKKAVGLVLGLGEFRRMLHEEAHPDLSGGLLESVGRLFRNDLRIFVFPEWNPETGQPMALADLHFEGESIHLFRYLMEKGRVRDITGYRPESLQIYARDVLRQLRSGSQDWELQVPPCVAEMIRKRKLLGYTPPAIGSPHS